MIPRIRFTAPTSLSNSGTDLVFCTVHCQQWGESGTMAHPVIKFGTDGWRGVIASDFTFENVRTAAAAIAAYVHAKEDPTKGLCIGFDSRFLSEAFART